MKPLIFLVLAVAATVTAEIKLTEETRPVKVEKSDDDLETGSSEHDLQASPYSYANAYGYGGGALGLYGNPFGYGGWYPYAQPYSHGGLYGGYGHGYGGYGAGYGGYGGWKGYYPLGATSYSHRYQEHYPAVYKSYGYGYPYYYGKYRSPYYGYGHAAYPYTLGHYGGYGHGAYGGYGGYGGLYKR